MARTNGYSWPPGVRREPAGGGPLKENNPLPLTDAQLGIWFAQSIDPSNPDYNLGEYLEIAGPIEAVAAALRAVAGVRAVTVQPSPGGRAVLRVDAPDTLRPALAQAAVAAGAQLFRLDVSADRLESLFLRLAGRGAAA